VKNWPYPTLFAHRGGGSLAPENTLAAMKTGNAHGYGAVEFDVKLSQDNVALLMHDATLERTTNGRGNVSEKNMAALEILDAGAWVDEKFLGERIPRFDAISNYLQTMGMTANVEIKPCPGREIESGRVVARLCEQLWRDELVKPLVSSFNLEALRAARKAEPNLAIGILVKIPEANHLALLEELGAVSMHCDQKHITSELVRLFHENGYRVMTYTVNETARVQALLDIGVDGIFTDNLAVMAAHFPLLLSRADTERV
jgi:glycerophosphoryl diester phosphodiesterase